MNLLPILLGFMLFSGFNKKNKDAKSSGGFNLGDLSGILSNPDLMGLLPHITKLFDKNASEEDKNAAMMALMTNPAMFEVIQKFTAKKDETSTGQNFGNREERQSGFAADGDNNFTAENNEFSSFNRSDNGKDANRTAYADGYSAESKEFFKPVEKVAGIEISQKLYKLYDNWYIKK